ncbi:EAL and HDOD domain-containing protein [Bacillota bacterium Meth-B3]|nr:HDOD domain-containing protein [Christensenellaceae bacterium]MEA5066222.1 HDOD domain-containing protein [Eubacteriales bacterium]MEA5068797.1 HDOD domain-containing protein [Christensenellaceae bacterium]
MDIYVARQPIFDRYMKVYGYELLYRRDRMNSFSGMDDDVATAELIYNSFLVMGLNDLTDGALAFINFSKGLIGSEIPYLLPCENVVLEVVERGEVTQATVEACKSLRAKGYKVALDDFVPDENNFVLLEHTDIVKVEFPAVSIPEQRTLLKQFGAAKTFLAEKIETREEYRIAADLGYSLFQGYFFSKPAIMNAKEIGSLNTDLIQIIKELNAEEPDLNAIAAHVEHDLGLSYKLLQLVNSVYYGPVYRIKTIWHALMYLGVEDLRRWFSIMMLKGLKNVENAEMIKVSLARAKLMELLVEELGDADHRSEYFFTGMFSFIDVLLNKPMKAILKGLPISDKTKRALLAEDNEYRRVLDCVIASEQGRWGELDEQSPAGSIGVKRFMELTLEALKWARRLEY